MRLALGCTLASAIVIGSACHTTKVVNLDQAHGWHQVSVTLDDESVLVVYDPQIYGTKLVGFVDGRYKEIPTAEVKQVQVRESDGTRTAALVAVGVVAAAGIAYAIAGSSKSGGTDYCDAPEHYNEAICQ